MTSTMQHDLDLLYEWLYNNLLSINADKTKYMIFHSPLMSVNSLNTTLKIDGKSIDRISEFKYLGLIIQDTLKWNSHIDNMIKKTAPLVGVLRRLNRCMPPHLLRSIYFAHIHSRLTYLSPIWGTSAPSYKLNDIQILQNKAIRSIFNIEYFTKKISTADILKKHHILNVMQLIQFNATVLFHQIKNKKIKK